MLDKVLHDLRPWEGHVFVEDMGAEFHPPSESILLDHGAEHHYILDPPIHDKFSINDAHVNPAAKVEQVAMCENGDPEWKKALHLVYSISAVLTALTKRAVERNYFLDKPKILQAIDEALWGPASARNNEYKKRHAYCFETDEEFLAESKHVDTPYPT